MKKIFLVLASIFIMLVSNAGVAQTVPGIDPEAPMIKQLTTDDSTVIIQGCGSTTLLIEGANFAGATAVTINGVAVASYTVTNSTTITATLPTVTTIGLIGVTTPRGTATSAGNFTVNAIVTPTFSHVATICYQGSLSALPTTSTNGVTGTWSPALDNSATTTYTFTPAAGQCATTTTMTITVNSLPAAPTISCYETATWNGITCQYDLTGTRPSAPTGLACYETATFNGCSWDVTGTASKPAPVVTNSTICSGETYTWTANGQVYAATQTTLTITNDGCTADQVLNLTVTPKPATVVTNAAICSGETYTWAASGLPYTTSQTALTITNDGCTANQVLNLTVTPKPVTVVTNQTICSGETYTWAASGLPYTTSQTALTITNDGCTADQVLNLTVTPKPATVVTNAAICSGEAYTWVANGLPYTTTQTAVTITNDGCTADQVLNLTVTPAPNAGTNGTLSLTASPSDAELFAALTGADTGGTWTRPTSGYVGVYTYTVSAISPCTETATATVTVTAATVLPAANTTFNFCLGAKVSALVAATGTGVKAYAVATGGVALLDVPLKGTTAKPGVYFLSEPTANGESLRVPVSVIINALPATPSTVVLTNEAISSTTAVTAVGLYAGTETPFKLTATPAGAASYKWSLPPGVVRTDATGATTDASTANTTANFIYVKFTGTGSATPLVISVQSVNASGCISVPKPSAALTRLLPAAPDAILVTDASLPVPAGKLPAALKSFAIYMGSPRELTLTATPSPAATSYVWELPEGINVTKNSASLVAGRVFTSGSNNVITVNFAGVTDANTGTYTDAKNILTHVLRIGVKAVNGVGSSITDNQTKPLIPATDSKAKLVTLTAVKPAASAFILTSAQTLAAGAKPVAISAISGLLGQNGVYKLDAKVSPFASSYVWNLPGDIVSRVTEAGTLITDVTNAERFSTQSDEPFIYVKFNKTTTLTAGTSIWFGVKAQNGIGLSDSSTANTTKYPELANNPIVSNSLLKLALALPTVGKVTGNIANVCANVAEVYTIAPSLASSYVITAPAGTVVTSPSNLLNATNVLTTSDLTFTVNYNNLVITKAAKQSIAITAINQVGPNAKGLLLAITTVTCTPVARFAAPKASVTENFNVIASPNPSPDVFTLEVQSSAKGNPTTNIQVYDMTGRLIEQRQAASNSVEIGNNYPTGVYNVIVNQAENTKTVRVIKK